MPRRARFDGAGTFRHVRIHGLARWEISYDDEGREIILSRAGQLVKSNGVELRASRSQMQYLEQHAQDWKK
jgi:hypothetical protein